MLGKEYTNRNAMHLENMTAEVLHSSIIRLTLKKKKKKKTSIIKFIHTILVEKKCYLKIVNERYSSLLPLNQLPSNL